VQTADIDTAILHWRTVWLAWRMQGTCALTSKKNCLTAVLKYFEYMKFPLLLFPLWMIEQYNCKKLQLDGWVCIEMRRAVWGIPQAGILANKCLRQKLAPFGYSECINTPVLWHHKSRPITFILVVDNFGVKFLNRDDVDHLIATIKKHTISLKIGPATYTVASCLSGTTSAERSISQCQASSK
jgi:hypothetical protein